MTVVKPGKIRKPSARSSSVRLAPGLEIKDVEQAHRLLLEAMGRGLPVTVDVNGVLGADTAGVQLLLCVQREAERRGIAIEFHGESTALAQVLTVLGLRDKMRMVAGRG